MAIRDDFTAGEVLAAADLNDTFASKPPFAYGTATPSTTVEGFIWYDENSTPPAPKFWDGAAFQAISAPSGLVHIATESFSAVSSVSLNGVFTSAYQNYKFLLMLSGVSANMNVQARLRASGSDATGANYQQNRIGVSNGSSFANRAAAETSWDLVNTDNGYRSAVGMDIFAPQIAATTLAHTTSGPNVDQAEANWRFVLTGHEHSLSTSYDGLTVLASSGNITGTIRVYGYANS